jgi:Ca2+-binding RTX toxin-like protein
MATRRSNPTKRFSFTEGRDVVTLPFSGGIWHALGGDDVVTGTSGADIIHGGAGADTLDGAGGIDSTDYYDDAAAGGTAGVYVDFLNGFAQDGFGTFDTLSNIEGATGTDRDRVTGLSDVMIGTNGTDYFDGRGGLDYIVGNGGDDFVITGAGMIGVVGDIAVAGAGNDTVYGGSGATFVYGNDGSDTIYGGTGDDWLFGGDFSGTVTGTDTMYGDDGNDVIAVGSAGGNAIMYGGTGNDIIYGGSGSPGDDWLIGGAGSDFMYAAAGNDNYFFAASDLVSGDFDQIYGFDAGDGLWFAAGLQGQISSQQATFNGVSGSYVSAGGWSLWIPYVDATLVESRIFYA